MTYVRVFLSNIQSMHPLIPPTCVDEIMAGFFEEL
jgi:hypothetical protein